MGYPKLLKSELIDEICLRTGLTTKNVQDVLTAYEEIAKEALLIGVEIPFGKLGSITWDVVSAKPQAKLVRGKMVKKPPSKYHKMTIRAGKLWREELRKATEIFSENETS